jgi:hypothetical protein
MDDATSSAPLFFVLLQLLFFFSQSSAYLLPRRFLYAPIRVGRSLHFIISSCLHLYRHNTRTLNLCVSKTHRQNSNPSTINSFQEAPTAHTSHFLIMALPASGFRRDEGGYLYGRFDEPFPSYPLDVLSMSFVNRLNTLNITAPTLSRIENELQRVQNDGLVDETGALLANELNQLSMKEREEVFHDIHGVAEGVEETPDLLNRRLEQLQLELDLLNNTPDKDAYNLAKAKSPEYVTSRKSGLMFLRAARFDTREAAAQIVRYYKEKLLVFGPESLARDICLTDLSREAVACLETGYRQLLPGRDRAGRAILLGIGNLRDDAYLQCTVSLYLCF